MDLGADYSLLGSTLVECPNAAVASPEEALAGEAGQWLLNGIG